ncbi:MAG TPA: four helix bundle protein [Verrucomicrobiota bacterium]|nr:four helix bundle protein [Verrucomicrobiota bacterium]
MQDFRQLQVWQKGHQLSLQVYRVTRGFPREEMFGLTSQMRRAATSITANLAEGRGRGSDADFARFLFVAMGSACELESFLELAKDLGFTSAEDHRTTLDALIEIKRMLAALIHKLSPARRPGSQPPLADG